MPAFSVSKSVHVNAPMARVFDSVRRFEEWPTWSPWLIAEPGCTVEHLGPDAYRWEGKIVGSGNMEVIGEQRPQAIDYRLHLIKPWKSQSDVRFTFKQQDGGTLVTWTLNGALPFFMFWLKGMMTNLLGMDYQRGLAMLKDHIETGAVPSTLDFPGSHPFPGLHYIGFRTTCPFAEIGPSMEASMGRLNDWMQENGEQPSGDSLSIYHKWNLKNGTADYTAAFPVAKAPDDLPSDLVAGNLPACTTYIVRHTGPYRHLGNAWAAAMSHKQAKVFAQNNKQPCFEIYEHCVGDPDDPANVTAIHLPIKLR